MDTHCSSAKSKMGVSVSVRDNIPFVTFANLTYRMSTTLYWRPQRKTHQTRIQFKEAVECITLPK
ncbi:MAG: hypothetical protein ACI9LE_001269 [Paraglaciecola sp.]|jgi:hypothetical protein